MVDTVVDVGDGVAGSAVSFTLGPAEGDGVVGVTVGGEAAVVGDFAL
ncbi:MAG: hypothetical protein KDB23_11710 [Planctomycetales bacterium]|nr:hypothetical protein [Planctomycetales bacterium]